MKDSIFSSSYLEPRQIGVINRLGDIMFPKNPPFPSFTELGVVEHVDLVLSELPEQDLNDLRLLLTILSFAPVFVLRGLLAFLEMAHNFPGPVGAIIRMVRFGLRGIVISLYYSGKKGHYAAAGVQNLHHVIGYNVSVYRGGSEVRSTNPAGLNQ